MPVSRSRPSASGIGRLAGAAVLVVPALLWSTPGRAAGDGTIVFTGSAAASGVQLRMTMPGAPVTDTPVDGGGPTAQVQMDSIGDSTGYASFPDPGGILITGPTTFTGLLAGGIGPIPPVTFPAPPPDYPFYVQSNAATAPQRSVGSGPYQLSTASGPDSSRASATSGVRTGAAGDLALVRSTATMQLAPAGDVIAEAVSDTAGVVAGPLTIGEVKSTARQVLSPGGTVTTKTALEISGMRIGTLPVSYTPDGLVIGSATQKLPVNETLASLLGPSHINLVVLGEQRFPGRVVAPAVRLDLPAPSASGKGSGTVSLILGRASVALTGQAAQSDTIGALPAVDNGAGPDGARPTAAPGGIDHNAPPGAGPEGAAAAPPSAAGPLPGALPGPVSAGPGDPSA
ncbi:MAG TPA: hypothetical protein VHL53_23760, partial [Acidimicrobiia bacterium]|nr:hypothetical protein [Acidimicrobiia bacterium]